MYEANTTTASPVDTPVLHRELFERRHQLDAASARSDASQLVELLDAVDQALDRMHHGDIRHLRNLPRPDRERSAGRRPAEPDLSRVLLARPAARSRARPQPGVDHPEAVACRSRISRPPDGRATTTTSRTGRSAATSAT